ARLVRSNSNSGRWWKRLETARFLSVAAAPADTARLLKLLRDPHPAVHIAAVATLERVESAALATAALDRLPQLAPTVSAYYAGMLRRSRTTVVQLLLTRLLLTALRDPDWWVRMRTGLALTRFGSAGRNALLAAEVGADPSARDMARLVLGLSAQALAEFAA